MKKLVALLVLLQGCAFQVTDNNISYDEDYCDKPIFLLVHEQPDLGCIEKRAPYDKDAAESLASYLYWKDRELTEESIFWYEKSIELGSVYGLLNYAVTFKGVDSDKYIALLELGVERNIVNAQYYLASYLLEHGGDEEKIVTLLRQAASQCHVLAIFNLVEQLKESSPDEASLWLIFGLSLSYSNTLLVSDKLRYFDALKQYFSVEEYVSFLKEQQCYLDTANPFEYYRQLFVR